MANSSVKGSLSKITDWVESLPKDKVQLIINTEPSINVDNYDYYVDYEVKILPRNPCSAGIIIWLCDNAIGYSISDFKMASSLINSCVSSNQEEFTCAGTEPVNSINADKILRICTAVMNSKIEVTGGVIFGNLKGIHTSIEIGDNCFLNYSFGQSLLIIKFLSYFGASKLVKIPFQKW